MIDAMALPDVIERVVAASERLRESRSGNEANTKALLIDPVLRALGWDLEDIDQVDREVPVFDNTKLDYALKIGGEPHLFLEAKGVTQRLDDKNFISQTVNYANNEGVVWCVLTNGLRYRVYKANEPVGMEGKLLFEVDLASDKEGSLSARSQILEQISRQAVSEGALDRRGEEVFTDKRVRDALAALAHKPPPSFLDPITRAMGKPAVSSELLSESLVRVITGEAAKPTRRESRPSLAEKAGPQPLGKGWSLDHHTNGKPSAIVDLFERVDEFARGLGHDVSRRITKRYVGYFAAKRTFFSIKLQRARTVVYLGLDPTETQPWNEHVMRDVREIGHWGRGDTEYSLSSTEQLPEVQGLIRRAYEQRR
jgi:predicted transport protein